MKKKGWDWALVKMTCWPPRRFPSPQKSDSLSVFFLAEIMVYIFIRDFAKILVNNTCSSHLKLKLEDELVTFNINKITF